MKLKISPATTYMTKEEVHNPVNKRQWELGGKDGEEPLRRIHVRLNVVVLKMAEKVWH